MQKRFIFALVVVQILLILLHLLVYKLFMGLFPELLPHYVGIRTTFLLLSLSFFVFAIPSYYYDNFFLRKGYVLSTIWMILGFYFLLAALMAWGAHLVFHLPFFAFDWPVLVAAGAFWLYGLLNARMVRLVEIKIKIPNLPPAWQGKTAVMASDLHLGQILRKHTARKIAKLINKQNPEIVFIPGDFYDGVHTDFTVLAHEFKIVKPPHGVYFSSGNHEAYAGYEQCEAALSHAGIKILEDEKVEVHGLQIAGLAYRTETAESIKDRIHALGLHNHLPTILLKHVPSHVHAVAETDLVDLQLSGHTHLGQIWPFGHIVRTVYKNYAYGFHKTGRMHLYTSSGVGTWGPPLRLAATPEIIKIIFE